MRINASLLADTEAGYLGHGLAKYYNHLVTLFEKQKAYSYVLEFAQLALSLTFSTTPDSVMLRSDMLSRQFHSALMLSRFDVAHSAVLALHDTSPVLQRACLTRLVERMSETRHSAALVALPLPGLTAVVDDILAAKCLALVDVAAGPAYHQILYAWRIRHQDYRGAASVLLDRIHKLQRSGAGDGLLLAAAAAATTTTEDDGVAAVDTAITQQYLLVINALSCVDAKQAWIFSEERGEGEGKTKRSVVTLDELRKQYQLELQRITAIQNNDFGFEEGDVMEI